MRFCTMLSPSTAVRKTRKPSRRLSHYLEDQLGRPAVDRALILFTTEFPPSPVYQRG